jgi:hypothetical protein
VVRNRVAAYSRGKTQPGCATAKSGNEAAPPSASIVLPAGLAVKAEVARCSTQRAACDVLASTPVLFHFCTAIQNILPIFLTLLPAI